MAEPTENTFTKKGNLKRNIGLFFIIGLLALGAVCSTSIVENVPAGNICVIQSPISGDLAIHFEPGIKLQMFGRVTMYPRSGIFEFLSPVDPDDPAEARNYKVKDDKSIKIQFNDSGAGWISGSIRYDYPMELDKMRDLHKTFQGHDNVINGLIKPNVERVINMTGPLMSSIESSRTRRAEIPMYVEDQLKDGLYETITKDKKVIDEITGQETTVKVAEFTIDKETGKVKRQSGSILAQYGLRVYNLNINKLSYEEKVLKRLDALFAADSEKQLAYMQAIKAEQDAKTAEKEGEAKATQAAWDAKAVTAKEVEQSERAKRLAIIEGEKFKEVAALEKQTAALYKDAQVLRAEADSIYKRKMMEADGALEQKLAAFVEINKEYAKAMKEYHGAWVPQIVMGNAGAANGNQFADMMSLFIAKAAKDLSLDMALPATSGNKK